MAEKKVGKVEHYYPKVQAAAVGLSGPLKVGDKVHIVGHGDDFEEEVKSLQLDHKPIQEGKPGQSVGLQVNERVHEGDEVYVVVGREPGTEPDSPNKGRRDTAPPTSREGKVAGAAERNAASRQGRKTASRAATRKAAKKPAGARATKAARKTPTRRKSSARARAGARSSTKGPKRQPARTATRGKRVRKNAGPKRKRPAGTAGPRTGGTRPGRRTASRKGTARKRAR